MLIFAAIVLSAYIFSLHWLKYGQIEKQIDEVSKFYKSIGTISVNGEYNSELDSLISDKIADNEYVEYVDKREESFAVLENICNADTQASLSWSLLNPTDTAVHNSDFVFTATVLSAEACLRTGVPGSTDEKIPTVKLVLKTEKIIAGYPDYAAVGDTVIAYYHIPEDEGENDFLETIDIGGMYLFRTYYDHLLAYDEKYNQTEPKLSLTLKTLDGNNLWFIKTEAGKEIDWSSAELQYLKNNMQIQDINRRAVNVINTKDMNAIPAFQDNRKTYFLESGRYIDINDNKADKNYCVIRKELAEKRNLEVGDKIDITYMDIGSDYYLYYDSYDISVGETKTCSYEIIGTFGVYPSNYGFDDMGFYFNDIYVTDSSLPEAFRNTEDISANNISFVLTSSEYENDFLTQIEQDDLFSGYKVEFLSNSATGFWSTANEVKSSAFVSAVVFTVLHLLVSVLLVYMYFNFFAKSYAIQSALGVPDISIKREILSPMLQLSRLASAAGVILSYLSVLYNNTTGLTEISGDMNVTVGATAPVVLYIVCVLIFAVNMRIYYSYFSKKSLFELLNAKEIKTNGFDFNLRKPYINIKSSLSLAFRVNKNIFRFIIRQPAKLAGITFVTMALISAVAFLNISIAKNEQEIDELYDSIVVTGTIEKENQQDYIRLFSFIDKRTVNRLNDTGYVNNIKLASQAAVSFAFKETAEEEFDLNTIFSPAVIYAVNDISGLIKASQLYNQVNIVYATNYDDTIFTSEYTVDDVKTENISLNLKEYKNEQMSFIGDSWLDAKSVETIVPVLISKHFSEEYQLNSGDCFRIFNGNTTGRLMRVQVAGIYDGIVIQGTVDGIIMPVSAFELMNTLANGDIFYKEVSFELNRSFNREIEKISEELQRIAQKPDAGLTNLKIIINDSELKSVVEPLENNLSRMKMLYPLAEAASLIMIGLICMIMVQHNIKEYSIMLSLGIPKWCIVIRIITEEMLLIMPGVLIALLMSLFIPVTISYIVIYILSAFAGGVIGSFAFILQKNIDIVNSI